METKRILSLSGKWLYGIIAVFFIVVLGAVGLYFSSTVPYARATYPGVRIGDIPLDGLSYEAVRGALADRINTLNQQGIPFTYQEARVPFFPVLASVEGDLAIPTVDIDLDATALDAYAVGRRGPALTRVYEQLVARFRGIAVPVRFSLNQEAVQTFINANFNRFETPAVNAALAYQSKTKNAAGGFTVVPESYGQVIDRTAALTALGARLAALDLSPVALTARIDYPAVKAGDIADAPVAANGLLDRTPVTLTHEERAWRFERGDIAPWLTLTRESGVTAVGLGRTATQYLASTVAPVIDQTPVDAKFEMKDGKVSRFQTSRTGRALDVAATRRALEQVLRDGRATTVPAIVTEVRSQYDTTDVNALGIKEIIGTGQSNFAGSPRNRRHNIATGAAAVNGTLIPPGEEFSLLRTLGTIDKSTGYLPELVIKEGKTIPEYGGGLCQIGTTVFRGTVASGLPVTMRRNHSYRVSYYEPAGTDATIYDPWPDYRFRNDTGGHVLIQSRTEGDLLYFDFWGTEDGRVATASKPTIYNIVRPGPTKIIETLSLKPGERKCTEKAHNGADAYFDYAITYPSGDKQETRFKSHYVPWREVCLLGVEKLTPAGGAASTTPLSADLPVPTAN